MNFHFIAQLKLGSDKCCLSEAAYADCSFVDNLQKFEMLELYLREDYFEFPQVTVSKKQL